MPIGETSITTALALGIHEITAAEWDACVGTADPFLRHAFFSAVEGSGCAARRTGWRPAHLVARRGGMAVGVAPMYVKSHSYGEYVFDHAWADAYQQAGGRYYPKLQACVPFTPVPGRRLAVAPGAPDETAAALVAAMERLAAENGFSSAHVAFADASDMATLRNAGWLERHGVQYHWFNRGYATFDDFLGTLSSRKRKQIKRERRTVAESSVTVHMLTGDDLRPAHWDAFHRLYLQTADRKWGGGYLNRAFFHQLGRTMGESVLLAMCEDRGEWVAGALNLIGADALYGRNWGADGSSPFLHFEACYYKAIEFAIARGLSRVEAGAQGEHKIQRGYQPVPTYSAHWIADDGLRRAVAGFLEAERRHMSQAIAELSCALPYRT